MKIKVIARILLLSLLIALTFLPLYGEIEEKRMSNSYVSSAAQEDYSDLEITVQEKIDVRTASKLKEEQIAKEKAEADRKAKEAAKKKADEEALRKAKEEAKAEEQQKNTNTERPPSASKKNSSSTSLGGSFKSYTNYRLLNKNSPQWTKIQCNPNAYTDNNGLRKVDGYYCVAMGSYYTRTLGDLFEIETEGGTFQVIICDFKADCDTDASNRYSLSCNCMVEFYVDMSCLNSTVRCMGNVSYANKNFKGDILRVTKIGNYFS